MDHHYDSAYYLAGYAVECALKAGIARQFREHDFPDKETVVDSYTHDLVKLVRVAGLEAKLNEALALSKDFKLNWLIVKDWSEESRYENRGEAQAEALIVAVADPAFGVLGWIQQHW